MVYIWEIALAIALAGFGFPALRLVCEPSEVKMNLYQLMPRSLRRRK